jgi:hypothetical protein
VRWRSRRERLRGIGHQRAAVAVAEPQLPCYRSPTIQELFSRLAPAGPRHVLDLGPVTSANVEFFSRFSCRLQIVNLLGTLAADPSRALLATNPAAALRQVLPRDARDFDVVLAWDVFNYLTREQARTAVRILSELTGPAAWVLAFIYTSKEMPAAARTFKIIDDHTLRWEQPSEAVRPSPRYPPAEVEKLFASFTIVRSVLMRHGMQEFLFTRRREE